MSPFPARPPNAIYLIGVLALAACTGDDPTTSLSNSTGPGAPQACFDQRYLASGAAKDAIRSVDDPVWVAADDPTELWYLSDGDRVVGFTVDGQAYAVPLNILWHREIVNATLDRADGPLDLAITHCPLTGSSLVFDRDGAGGAELGVTGILYKSNLVMYDRNAAESFWPQMLGGTSCGPGPATTLAPYPSIEMRWDGWLDLYPDTKVLGAPGGGRSGYDTNPYAGYDQLNSGFNFPMPALDPRLPPKALVFGVKDGSGRTWAFPFSRLDDLGASAALARSFASAANQAVVFWDRDRQAASAYDRSVGAETLTFRGREDGIFDLETGSLWTVDGLATDGPLAGARLERVPSAYVAYWGAWQAFFPFVDLWGL